MIGRISRSNFRDQNFRAKTQIFVAGDFDVIFRIFVNREFWELRLSTSYSRDRMVNFCSNKWRSQNNYDPPKRSEKFLFSKFFFSKFFSKVQIFFGIFFLMKNRFFYIKGCYADHHKGYLCSDYNVREHSVRLTCSRTCVRTCVYKDRANKNFKSKNFKNKPKNVINLIKFEGVKFFKISLSKRSSILIGRKARGSIHQAVWLALSLEGDERWVPADEYVQDRQDVYDNEDILPAGLRKRSLYNRLRFVIHKCR